MPQKTTTRWFLVRIEALVLCLFSLSSPAEELRFRGPSAILNVPRPVTVHAGDVDGNGKLDLIASSGGNAVLVYFQDDENRESWTTVSVPVGASSFFTRAGDFDGDGFDDLAVADGGSDHLHRTQPWRPHLRSSAIDSRGSRLALDRCRRLGPRRQSRPRLLESLERHADDLRGRRPVQFPPHRQPTEPPGAHPRNPRL